VARETVFDRVDTPEKLDHMVQGVVKGIYPSLIIVGRGGTGKSTVVRKHFPENDELDPPANSKVGAFWKKGRISPVKFYEHLYRWQNRTIVLDDAPGLAKNLALAGLLRQLCETETKRRISWDTQNATMEDKGIATSFLTTSRFIMITNRWMDRHDEVEALETRCPIIKYDPSVSLIHEKAKSLGYDKEVVAFVGKAIKDEKVHHLNFRDYINACRRKANGDEWKAILEQQFLPDEIDDLADDAQYIRSLVLRLDLRRFTTGDLYRKSSRFKGDKVGLEQTVTWMVSKGILVALPPRPNTSGPGRRPSTEYALSMPIISESPKARKSRKAVAN
jgi:hypothetical protein